MTTNPRLASRDPQSEAQAYAYRPCDEISAGSNVTQTDPALAHRRRFGKREPAHAENDSRFTGKRPNAELTGRRRAQRGGYLTATPLGARVERRVGLCSKALTQAYRDLHESTSPAGDHDRSHEHEPTACVTRFVIGGAGLCVPTLRRDQCRSPRDANGFGARTQKPTR